MVASLYSTMAINADAAGMIACAGSVVMNCSTESAWSNSNEEINKDAIAIAMPATAKG